MSRKRSILIVDDDYMIRTLAHKVLDRAGFNIVLAASSDEAIAVLEDQSGECDLVIVDYNLDDLSGVDLANVIRSQIPAIPIILSSGEPIEPGDIPPELQANIYVLPKPYRSEELVDLAQTALTDS